MSLKVQKDKVRLSAITHEVRASQAVLQYGVGAMVDFPEQTLMTAAPEYWEDSTETIHDERLEKLLHVTHFVTPKNYGDAKNSDGVSYVRFPEWYFCPKCREFKPISKWINDYRKKGRPKEIENDPYMARHPRCPVCRQDLVVARIVTVCECGHIDDFPWIKWVHCQNIGGSKPICSNPQLKFKTSATSSEGLEGLSVSCETCKARATLKGAFDPGKFEKLDKQTSGRYGFTCTGRHPWKNEKETCNRYPRVKQRGSSSVYFPASESSLVIPPYSSRLTERIEASRKYDECKTVISSSVKIPGLPAEAKATIIEANIQNYSHAIAIEISAQIDKVISILRRKWQTNENEVYSTTSVRYRAEEYDALTGDIAITADREDGFLRESTDISKYNMPFLKGVSLIHRIKEVEALTGFSRLNPIRYGGENSSNGFVHIKQPETDWYPACETYGEGIFIEFDNNAINSWRNGNSEIQKRVEILNENYKKSFIGSSRPRTITSKFLLLHTISHLLIKQLSFECGYSIASLKERLYCSEEVEGKEMAGILIYTAVGDSEGTLGGLVRQGRPDTLPQIFEKAILSAVTCSNDPVCSLSYGQGRDSLNLSACYSCALIPETCCEEFNVFLDRGTVIGVFDHRDIGFFSDKVWDTKSNNKINENTSPGDMSNCEENKNDSGTIIFESGTDVSDSSYSDILFDLLQWCSNDNEKKLLENLSNHVEWLNGKEKPFKDAFFRLTNNDFTRTYKCSLLWKKSRVAFFTEDEREDFEAARNTDWKCYYSSDLQMNGKEMTESIKGAH